jgi:hypothetical protein
MSYACPICSASLDPVLRYPRYVCRDCASKTAAADGRQLQFSNVGFSRSLSDFPLPKRIDSIDNKLPPRAVMAHESIHPGRP